MQCNKPIFTSHPKSVNGSFHEDTRPVWEVVYLRSSPAQGQEGIQIHPADVDERILFLIDGPVFHLFSITDRDIIDQISINLEDNFDIEEEIASFTNRGTPEDWDDHPGDWGDDFEYRN